jgi:hypothetical protein
MFKTDRERDQLILTIGNWKRAAPVLDKIRVRSIRASDTAQAILQLQDAFESALLHYPASLSSGLVEQQRLFRSLRR